MSSAPGSLSSARPVVGNRQLLTALGVLVSVLLAGTIGFMLIESWDVWRAFYFTLITITTVGYGDEGISEEGRKFATVLLLGGIGTASYSLATLVQFASTTEVRWSRRMQKRVEALKGHIIVCGFGRLGQVVCEELSEAGEPFVVIEPEEKRIHAACDAGYLAVQGSAAEDDCLQAARVDRARHLVSAVQCEAEGIAIALTARGLNADLTIIARAEGDNQVRKLLRAGADHTVSPCSSGGHEVVNAVLRPRVAEFLATTNRAQQDVILSEIKVEAGSPLHGMTLQQCGREHASKVSFVALERASTPTQIPPSGSECLQTDDQLIVAGDREQILSMKELAVGAVPVG